MYGLEGSKAVLGPGGTLPSALPVVLPDGSIGRPGTPVPHRPVPVVVRPSSVAVALEAPLPWADVPRRRRS
jgi:hypothetical protein